MSNTETTQADTTNPSIKDREVHLVNFLFKDTHLLTEAHETLESAEKSVKEWMLDLVPSVALDPNLTEHIEQDGIYMASQRFTKETGAWFELRSTNIQNVR
jgi:hypothetical protein